jgi:RNA polymerase sigma-70 factor (ECF subfamily)
MKANSRSTLPAPVKKKTAPKYKSQRLRAVESKLSEKEAFKNLEPKVAQESFLKVDKRPDEGKPSKDPVVRKEQFEALAMPLANLLYATALRMVRNTAKAEDLVQETYVRAWQNFDRFTLGTNFKAWAFQILTFLYKNERRSAKSRETTVDYSGNEILPAPTSPDPHLGDTSDLDWESLYPDLVDDQFKRALDRLDEERRSALLLVTLGELSYQECAELQGIPIGTVMSRLFRARKQLQEELGDYALSLGLTRGELDEELDDDGESD